MSASELTVDSPMADILRDLPGARRSLFARYHLGGCQSCGFPDHETLAALAKRAGDLDPEEMLAFLLESHAHDQAMLLQPEAARQALDEQPPPRLIDVRTREEHEAVMIPGSLFLTETLQQELFALEQPGMIILYDHQGRHVLDHCSWFRGHGLTATYAIEGGIDAWSQQVDPSLRRYRLEVDGSDLPG